MIISGANQSPVPVPQVCCAPPPLSRDDVRNRARERSLSRRWSRSAFGLLLPGSVDAFHSGKSKALVGRLLVVELESCAYVVDLLKLGDSYRFFDTLHEALAYAMGQHDDQPLDDPTKHIPHWDSLLRAFDDCVWDDTLMGYF